MPRRWEVDGDHRVPHGFKLIGYDADTQVRTWEAPDGSLWEGNPGAQYGELTMVSGPRQAPVQQHTGGYASTSRTTSNQTARPPTPPRPRPSNNSQGESTPERSKSGALFKRLARSVSNIKTAAERLSERTKAKKEEKEAKRQKEIDQFLKGGQKPPDPYPDPYPDSDSDSYYN
ncbi:hypothetical protein F5Y05DRAFT_407702 [Hypoxylon sp. FL0543]|nr:hypothetical protein F5Y05DRAFT_407702 [Hypoxylon sp. FL0543]